MDMDAIWGTLDDWQTKISNFRAPAASSSNAAPESVLLPRLRQVNDSVFEVCAPAPPKRPSVEIVFFHGLEFKRSQEPHITTWLSRDGSELWLNWLLNDFPDARILVVSYDAHVKRTDTQGRTDRYITGENLMRSLTQLGADVGQEGCPVVLVGHCIGGNVIKELCLHAHTTLSLDQSEFHVQKFLQNLKGLFFYATPHHGTRFADIRTKFIKGPLFEDVTTLNTEAGRQNAHFTRLRRNNNWITFGVGESFPITLGTFKGIVVPEASARHDADGFYTAPLDHFEICRPKSTTSSSFVLLSDFVVELGVVKEVKTQHGTKIDFSDEVVEHQGYVNTDQVYKILRKLETAQRLAICGMGGVGKTTLAKMVYNKISGRFDYTCFVGEVKNFITGRLTMEDLRTEITKRLYAKGCKVDPSFEWSTLQGKSVLVVLDDVNDFLAFQVITEEVVGFSNDSRVIITSRDRELLPSEEFELYYVRLLGKEDSGRLLCHYAFETEGLPTGFEYHVERVTKKCGGLPLALKVVGRCLNKVPKCFWDDVLQRLRCAESLDGSRMDELWSILRMSFDLLANQEREMFLDVAVVFHGERLHEAKDAWTACGWAADSGWDNLLEKGLVEGVSSRHELKEDNSDNAIIRMHEVLRDLGRAIACWDPEHISRHSRVCWDQRELSTWPFSEGESEVKVLKINWYHPVTNLDSYTFSELKELKVLLIYGTGDLSRLFSWLSGARHSLPHKLVYLKIKGFHGLLESSSRLEESSSQTLEQNRPLLCLRIEGYA